MPPGKDPDLPPWVLEFTRAHTSKNFRSKFPGYVKAYIVAFLHVYQREFGEWPTYQDVKRVFNYSQINKPMNALRELEDEGYVKLDETRCRIVDVFKEAYYVPRPAFAKEKINDYLRHLSSEKSLARFEGLDIQWPSGP